MRKRFVGFGFRWPSLLKAASAMDPDWPPSLSRPVPTAASIGSFTTFELEVNHGSMEANPPRAMGFTPVRLPTSEYKRSASKESAEDSKSVKPFKQAFKKRKAPLRQSRNQAPSAPNVKPVAAHVGEQGTKASAHAEAATYAEAGLVQVPSVSAQGLVLDGLLDSPSAQAVHGAFAQACAEYEDQLGLQNSLPAEEEMEQSLVTAQEIELSNGESGGVQSTLHRIDVLKSVTLREQYLDGLKRVIWSIMQTYERLQILVRGRRKEREESAPEQEKLLKKLKMFHKQLAVTIKNLRKVSCDTLRAIKQWRILCQKELRKNMQSVEELHCFFYEGENYVKKMMTDLNWIDDNGPVAMWVGFKVEGNPMLMPPDYLDVRSGMEHKKNLLMLERAEERRKRTEEEHKQMVLQMRMKMAQTEPSAVLQEAAAAATIKADAVGSGSARDAEEGQDDEEEAADDDDDDEAVVDGMLMMMALPDTQLVEQLAPHEGAAAYETAAELVEEVAVQQAWIVQKHHEAQERDSKYNPFAAILSANNLTEIFDDVVERRGMQAAVDAIILREHQEDQQRAKVTPLTAKTTGGGDGAGKVEPEEEEEEEWEEYEEYEEDDIVGSPVPFGEEEDEDDSTFLTGLKVGVVEGESTDVVQSGVRRQRKQWRKKKKDRNAKKKRLVLSFDKERLLAQISEREQTKAAFLREAHFDAHLQGEDANDGGFAIESGAGEVAVGHFRRRGMAGHVISYRAQYLHEERAAAAQEMESAAVTVQAVYRGHHRRRRLDADAFEKRSHAAKGLQAVFRGHHARVDARLHREEQRFSKVEKGAATNIQQAFRGKMGRKKAKIEREYRYGPDDGLTLGEARRRKKQMQEEELNAISNSVFDHNREQWDSKDAAEQIQKTYKVHQTKRDTAVTMIESRARGALARRKTHRMKQDKQKGEAAVKIQAIQRRKTGIKLAESERRQLESQRSHAVNAGEAAAKAREAAERTARRAQQLEQEVDAVVEEQYKMPPLMSAHAQKANVDANAGAPAPVSRNALPTIPSEQQQRQRQRQQAQQQQQRGQQQQQRRSGGSGGSQRGGSGGRQRDRRGPRQAPSAVPVRQMRTVTVTEQHEVNVVEIDFN
jgi:hypothetical protein